MDTELCDATCVLHRHVSAAGVQAGASHSVAIAVVSTHMAWPLHSRSTMGVISYEVAAEAADKSTRSEADAANATTYPKVHGQAYANRRVDPDVATYFRFPSQPVAILTGSQCTARIERLSGRTEAGRHTQVRLPAGADAAYPETSSCSPSSCRSGGGAPQKKERAPTFRVGALPA